MPPSAVESALTRLQATAIRAITLQPTGVVLLDQTALPETVRTVTVCTPIDMITAIQAMIVRGAPAIGIAGAYGVVLSARQHQTLALQAFSRAVRADAQALANARPTAVNLAWAVEQLLSELAVLEAQEQSPAHITQVLEETALAIHEADLLANRAMGQYGAKLLPKGARILTHCNAGALATGGYGTALGVIRAAFEQDPGIQVYASETRPRLQGARLTTWELAQDGIAVTLITDNMAGWLMQQGRLDAVIVGADRIAANGDTANKIGTYSHAVLAKAHGLPFYVAAPWSTVDLDTPSGQMMTIEERSAQEVTELNGERLCAEGIAVYNPAFDVTPAQLITAIITERGVYSPDAIAVKTQSQCATGC